MRVGTWKRAGMAVLMALVMSFLLAGCSDGGSGGKGRSTMMAGSINDGATAMNRAQAQCPVCGSPISPDVHTASEENRVYFDREECLAEYKKNPDKYEDKVANQGPAGTLKKMMQQKKKGK